jgi:exosortase
VNQAIACLTPVLSAVSVSTISSINIMRLPTSIWSSVRKRTLRIAKGSQDKRLCSIQWGTGTLSAVLIVPALLAIMYVPVLGSLARQWSQDPNYSHGFLVPLFASYAFWRERANWRDVAFRPSHCGFLIMLFAVILLIFGTLGMELFTARFSLLVAVSGIVVFLTGWQMLRSIAFPISYLLFMIPLPAVIYYQLTFPLQLMASRLGAHALVAFGVPTIREGNLLILPNCTLDVVEACSGVRSILSLLAAAVAYGYVAEPRLWKRCVLVMSAIPVAVVSNGLRLVAAGVLSFLLGPEADSGRAHSMLGLAFFVVAVLSILVIHKLLDLLSSHQDQVVVRS